MEYFIGFVIGLLCGVIPMAFGLFVKHRILAVISVVSTSVTGVIFSILDKSPFTAIGVAIVFVVILFSKNKNKNAQHEHDDHDMYVDDE